jgi:hypothetical protein
MRATNLFCTDIVVLCVSILKFELTSTMEQPSSLSYSCLLLFQNLSACRLTYRTKGEGWKLLVRLGITFIPSLNSGSFGSFPFSSSSKSIFEGSREKLKANFPFPFQRLRTCLRQVPVNRLWGWEYYKTNMVTMCNCGPIARLQDKQQT